MSLAKFLDEPWRNSHPAYLKSGFAMSPAPEYASSEVILSSLYRHIGFEGVSERTVPVDGRRLDSSILRHRDRKTKPNDAALGADTFHILLHSVMESPKLPNQSSKRFIQITPLVPQTAVISGSARLAGNSWPAGALVRSMVRIGSVDDEAASLAWSSLFDALSVTRDDDVFARFLEEEIRAWNPSGEWGLSPTVEGTGLDPSDQQGLNYPARRFVRDLDALISAKDSMTRRQWTSLLDSVVRLAAVAHVVWLCEIHARIWDCVRTVLKDREARPQVLEVRSALFPQSFSCLEYGDRALPTIKDRISAFLEARLGLNAVLWELEGIGIDVESLSSSSDVVSLCDMICDGIDATGAAEINSKIIELNDRQTRTLLCKKGIGSNMMEFARHVLGQRQAASPVLRGYDQGYALRKLNNSNSSPWIVSLGPVAVLALVHCSLAGVSGPRSVRRLSQHLAEYGVALDYREIATNDLGHQLRMLGLVLDSPDAESGMLLVPPFNGAHQ